MLLFCFSENSRSFFYRNEPGNRLVIRLFVDIVQSVLELVLAFRQLVVDCAMVVATSYFIHEHVVGHLSEILGFEKGSQLVFVVWWLSHFPSNLLFVKLI